MEIDGPAREGDAYGVADLDVSAISDEAQVKAGAAFDASVKKGSPLKDAVQSGLSTGGAVAAASWWPSSSGVYRLHRAQPVGQRLRLVDPACSFGVHHLFE